MQTLFKWSSGMSYGPTIIPGYHNDFPQECVRSMKHNSPYNEEIFEGNSIIESSMVSSDILQTNNNKIARNNKEQQQKIKK